MASGSGPASATAAAATAAAAHDQGRGRQPSGPLQGRTGELPMTREEAERRAAALTADGLRSSLVRPQGRGRLGGREGGAAAGRAARPAQAGRTAGHAADARWPAARVPPALRRRWRRWRGLTTAAASPLGRKSAPLSPASESPACRRAECCFARQPEAAGEASCEAVPRVVLFRTEDPEIRTAARFLSGDRWRRVRTSGVDSTGRAASQAGQAPATGALGTVAERWRTV